MNELRIPIWDCRQHVGGGFWHKFYNGAQMNERLLNKLGLEVGGSHFPAVFADYQEAYVKKVLQQCYHVMLNSQENTDSYLAVDLMFDICKHFDLNPALLYKNNEKI